MIRFHGSFSPQAPRASGRNDGAELDIVFADQHFQLWATSAPEIRDTATEKTFVFCRLPKPEGSAPKRASGSVDDPWREVDGDYIAIRYDQVARHVHILADPVGRCPFFYAADKGVLRFASEPGAIPREARRDLDPLGVADLLVFETPLENRTLWRGIRVLSPGKALHMDRSGESSSVRWAVDTGPTAAFGDATACARELFDVLLEQLDRWCGDEPSIMLSGGIDSRLLLGAMLQARRGIRDVWVFGDLDSPDAATAARLAQHCGLKVKRLSVNSESLIPLLPDAVKRTDGMLSLRMMPGLPAYLHMSSQSTMLVNGFAGDVVHSASVVRGIKSLPETGNSIVGSFADSFAHSVAHLLPLVRDPNVRAAVAAASARVSASIASQPCADPAASIESFYVRDYLRRMAMSGDLLVGAVVHEFTPYYHDPYRSLALSVPSALRCSRSLAAIALELWLPRVLLDVPVVSSTVQAEAGFLSKYSSCVERLALRRARAAVRNDYWHDFCVWTQERLQAWVIGLMDDVRRCNRRAWSCFCEVIDAKKFREWVLAWDPQTGWGTQAFASVSTLLLWMAVSL